MMLLIVDDHPLVCSALETTLAHAFPCDIMQAHSAAEAARMVSMVPDIDLMLLDLKLPDVEGFQGLSQLRRQAPKIPILVLSGLEDARLAQLVRSYGAMGFLSKKAGPGEIVYAVRTVLAGETLFESESDAEDIPDENRERIARRISQLTPQQRIVLGMLGEGRLNKQIAHELSITESTVKAHVSAILSKLEVASRMQAVLIAQGGVFNHAPESVPAPAGSDEGGRRAAAPA